MAKKLLIELPYLGNLAFYQLLTKFDSICIEKQEFFEKSSYRNRCDIAGVNGKLILSVPVKGGKHKKQFYKETEISYEHPWEKDHWNSWCSAYRRSPYFEYYEDRIKAIYTRKHSLLFDFNWDFFQEVLKMLKLEVEVSFTKEFQKEAGEDMEDYRSYFLPKYKQESSVVYHQVFQDRNTFINNLSIADLLFNEGPNALSLLKEL